MLLHGAGGAPFRRRCAGGDSGRPGEVNVTFSGDIGDKVVLRAIGNVGYTAGLYGRRYYPRRAGGGNIMNEHLARRLSNAARVSTLLDATNLS